MAGPNGPLLMSRSPGTVSARASPFLPLSPAPKVRARARRASGGSVGRGLAPKPALKLTLLLDHSGGRSMPVTESGQWGANVRCAASCEERQRGEPTKISPPDIIALGERFGSVFYRQ
jgi:hypothetical protein